VDPGAKLRYSAGVGPRNTLVLLLVTACQAPPVGHTGFSSTPDVSTAPSLSTGDGSTSSNSSGTSTGEDSGAGGGSADTTAEPVRDLGGMPDFGNDSPIGCKGKIDFLFVIARNANMEHRQEQLTAAFPQFIDTIKSRFVDFDYHIMVVTGDSRVQRRRSMLRLERPRPTGETLLHRSRLSVPGAGPRGQVRPDLGGRRAVSRGCQR